MSINHFMNKIKGQIGIDGTTFLLLLILILVGLGSFGLGRFSVSNINDNNKLILDNKNINIVKGEIGENAKVIDDVEKVEEMQKEKMYVASKNGKLYYTLNCNGASRISEKNRIWFASSSDAERAGYEFSSSCK